MDECKHEGKIAMLDQNQGAIKAALDKLDQKVDLVLYQINKVAILEANHDNHKEAITRLFTRVEGVQEEHKQIAAFKNRIEGGLQLAWILWGTLSALMVAIAVKVFT